MNFLVQYVTIIVENIKRSTEMIFRMWLYNSSDIVTSLYCVAELSTKICMLQ